MGRPAHPADHVMVVVPHAGLEPGRTACRLDPGKLRWHPGASVCLVLASGGYPGKFETGKEVTGLAAAAKSGGAKVLHAGTAQGPAGGDRARIVTSGGRVLGVTATAGSLPLAIYKAYEAVDKIHFEGSHCRTDIGAKGDLRWSVPVEAPRV